MYKLSLKFSQSKRHSMNFPENIFPTLKFPSRHPNELKIEPQWRKNKPCSKSALLFEAPWIWSITHRFRPRWGPWGFWVENSYSEFWVHIMKFILWKFQHISLSDKVFISVLKSPNLIRNQRPTHSADESEDDHRLIDDFIDIKQDLKTQIKTISPPRFF